MSASNWRRPSGIDPVNQNVVGFVLAAAQWERMSVRYQHRSITPNWLIPGTTKDLKEEPRQSVLVTGLERGGSQEGDMRGREYGLAAKPKVAL